MFISIIKIFINLLLSLLGGVLAILLIPFNRGGRTFHWLARTYSKTVLWVSGVKVKSVGTENIGKNQSYIYVSNHASGFDIPAVIAGIPDQIRIVYKKELEKIPFFGWGLKYGKTYIAIDRQKGTEAARSLEEAAEKIRTGASVLLFAEGTRTLDGKLQPFKRGAFNLAVKAGVSVIPLTINGSYKILPKKKYRLVPGTVTLVIGKPIEVNKGGGKEEELNLMSEVHKIISKHYIDQ
ncbi:MAG: lysophospholipid acyltransferase family protein [Bacteroidota bacterium]|nr:lysophospholipid acyltransferase family protein [Bacteroidota bacterium]